MSSKTVRTMQGEVVDNRRAQTITVRIDGMVKHPLVGKFMKRSKLVHVHAENSVEVGAKVVIRSCRPRSKTKSWELDQVVGS